MKTKPNLVTILQRWTFYLLSALAVVLFSVYTLYLIHITESRTARLRAQYLEAHRQTIKSEVLRLTRTIEYEMGKMLSGAKTQVKERVLATHNLAENIYLQNRETKSEKEIQKLIIDSLRPIRLDQGGGYYFIINFNGIIQLFADRPDREKISLSDHQDTRGRYVIREMIDIVRSGPKMKGSTPIFGPSRAKRGMILKKSPMSKSAAPLTGSSVPGFIWTILRPACRKPFHNMCRPTVSAPGPGGMLLYTRSWI